MADLWSYIPLHVNDGLGITNSKPPYIWFLSLLSQHLHVVDLGPCAKFLNLLIIWDCPGCRLWLSSKIYIAELLEEWNMTSSCSASTPFPSNLPDLSFAPPNSLPSISDADLLTQLSMPGQLSSLFGYNYSSQHFLLRNVVGTVQCQSN